MDWKSHPNITCCNIPKVIRNPNNWYQSVVRFWVESWSKVVRGPMIKLTATNYSLWKSMIEDLLNFKDLYDPIEGDNAKPDNMSNANWKKLKKKTLAAIRQ